MPIEGRSFRGGAVWVSDDNQGVTHIHFASKSSTLAGARGELILVREAVPSSALQIERTRLGICAHCGLVVPADDSFPFAATIAGRESHMRNCTGIGLPTGPAYG